MNPRIFGSSSTSSMRGDAEYGAKRSVIIALFTSHWPHQRVWRPTRPSAHLLVLRTGCTPYERSGSSSMTSPQTFAPGYTACHKAHSSPLTRLTPTHYPDGSSL